MEPELVLGLRHLVVRAFLGRHDCRVSKSMVKRIIWNRTSLQGSRSQQTLSIKDKIVNSLDFEGHS